MKRLTQIFQALLGVVALILTAIVAFGRLAWRTIRNWWKKRSKWLRRSIATILILIPVGFVALVGYALYEDAYGRDYWDRKLSENVTLRSFSDNKWRVYNKQTGEYTTEKINWVSEALETDSLAVYALNYMLLQMETYALLAGSVVLFLLLCVVMYLTANINNNKELAKTK